VVGSWIALNKWIALNLTPRKLLSVAGATGLMVISEGALANDRISQLLNFFGPGCSQYGSQSQSAVQDVGHLTAALEALKKDPECQPSYSAFLQLNSVQSRLSYFENSSTSTDLEISQLEQRRSEILHLLSITSDPVEISILKNELVSTRLSLASYQGRRESTFRDQKRIKAAGSLISTTDRLFNQVAANHLCWKKHPNILSDVAMVGEGVGSSLAMAAINSNWIASAVTAGVSLVAQLMKYFEEAERNDEIRSMARTVAPVALSCTFETLADKYCAAMDLKNMIQLSSRVLQAPREKDSLFDILNLLERDLPFLVKWLESVKSGAPISGSTSASLRGQVYASEFNLKYYGDQVIGIIEDTRKLLDLGGEAKKIEFLTDAYKKIMNILYSGLYNQGQCKSFNGTNSSSNPYAESRACTEAVYFLLGATGQANTSVGFDELPTNQRDDILRASSINTISENFARWRSDANVKLELERSLKFNEDTQKIFAEADRITYVGGRKGYSVSQTIDRLISYLNAQEAQAARATDLTLIRETSRVLVELRTIIQAVREERMPPKEGISKILKSAFIDSEYLPFTSRLVFLAQSLFEETVIKRYNSPGSSSSLSAKQALVLLAAQDMLASFREISASSNLQRLNDDSNSAQSILVQALDRFSQVFSSQINEALEQFDGAINMTQEKYWDESNAASKAIFCFNIAASPRGKGQLNFGRCNGARMVSTFGKKLSSVAMDSSYLSRPLSDRICARRDYLRKNSIFQSLAGGSGDRYGQPPKDFEWKKLPRSGSGSSGKKAPVEGPKSTFNPFGL